MAYVKNQLDGDTIKFLKCDSKKAKNDNKRIRRNERARKRMVTS